MKVPSHRYGLWTVLGLADKVNNNYRVYVKCDCGIEKIVYLLTLINGSSKSCGCLRRKLASERQSKYGGKPLSGDAKRAYNAFKNMHRRCSDPRDKSYKYYGARGISVCETWQDFEVFVADMGLPPKGGTIDRINNDGNYEKGNCKWNSAKEQNNNRRDNFHITYNGKTLTMAQWADRLGMRYGTLQMRIWKYGWSVEEALTRPV